MRNYEDIRVEMMAILVKCGMHYDACVKARDSILSIPINKGGVYPFCYECSGRGILGFEDTGFPVMCKCGGKRGDYPPVTIGDLIKENGI